MSEKAKLIFIKLLHTFVWLVLMVLIGYVWYVGITNDINYLVWIAIILILFEGILLLANHFNCPLTRFATKYTKNPKPGFDIFLPSWLAKYNIPFFTIISIIGIILVIFKAITK